MGIVWKNKSRKNKRNQSKAAMISYVKKPAESNGHICKVDKVIFTKSNLDLLPAYVSNQEKIEKIKAVRL